MSSYPAVAAPPAPTPSGAASASPLAQAIAAIRDRADTPRVLQAAMAAIWLAVLVLVLVGNAVVADARQTVQTIGKDAAPSIVASQSMKASMADMDAYAANDLLGGPNGIPEARDTYEQDRLKVMAGLVAAAKNITYPGEEPLIQRMENGMSQYAAYVAQARVYNQLGDVPSAMSSLKTATDLMHQEIIPAADALDALNLGYLDRAYAARRQADLLSRTIVVLVGLVTLGLLVALQVYLARRTRRLLNVPLLAATLVALVLVARLVSVLGAVAADLKWAKQDSFDSVHALWQARAIAYDANGDESLYLLPGFDQQRYTQSFQQKAAELADRPVTDQLVNAAAAGSVQFKGRLADELNNITFAGEREAAVEALRTWGVYVAIDPQIRALEQAGRHAEAVALCLGMDPGQSNWAFYQFDEALGRVLQINEDNLAAATQRAFDDLSGAEIISVVAALVVAVLVWLGLRPRIAEYHG
jgi:hypothetical protein